MYGNVPHRVQPEGWNCRHVSLGADPKCPLSGLSGQLALAGVPLTQ